MQVTLKVIGGKNDGREIRISVPEFVIGRGEQAHLRPNSDLISRKHCAIKVERGKVIVEDLGSRNGTVVNDEVIAGPHVAKVGDILRVGRLQFEIVIDHAQSGNKQPRPENIAEVARRTVSRATQDAVDEDSITDWLAEPVGDPDREISETRQFRLDETTQMFTKSENGDEATELNNDQDQDDGDEAEQDTNTDAGGGGLFSKKKKKEAGKLPPRPKFSSDSSTTAADDVLKQFFNRR